MSGDHSIYELKGVQIRQDFNRAMTTADRTRRFDVRHTSRAVSDLLRVVADMDQRIKSLERALASERGGEKQTAADVVTRESTPANGTSARAEA